MKKEKKEKKENVPYRLKKNLSSSPPKVKRNK